MTQVVIVTPAQDYPSAINPGSWLKSTENLRGEWKMGSTASTSLYDKRAIGQEPSSIHNDAHSSHAIHHPSTTNRNLSAEHLSSSSDYYQPK